VEVANLYVAIEQVVQRMNVFVRSIARRRLRAPNRPTPEIEIDVTPNAITVNRIGQSKVTTKRDGSSTRWHGPGGVFRVTRTLDDGGRTVNEKIVGKGSHSTNRYSFAPDGGMLTIQTTIASSRLPTPIEFTMTYRHRGR